MSRFTSEDHARETGPTWRYIRGMLRRMVVTLAGTAAKWQVRGQVGGTGGDEVVDIELYPGIGVFARPPADGAPEAIVAALGGMKTSAIIATRDEKTRALVAAQVEPGETALYNKDLIFILKASGDFEARTIAGGVVDRVALLSDVQGLRDYVRNQFSAASGHTHAVVGGATTTIVTVAAPGTAPTVAPPTPVGSATLSVE